MTRRVILNDLVLLARALMPVEPARRTGYAQHLLDCASYADIYRLRLKRPHPRWGDGSIASVARSVPCAAPSGFGNRDFAACFELALAVVRTHTSAQQSDSGNIA